jgi:hypothetical protein
MRSPASALTAAALATGLATALATALALGTPARALAADAGAKPPADPPKHPVVDPHYGDVLFEFFQNHYFPALVNLEVSQHFERMPHHADEAEVLRGGLLLSYGMHQQAGEVFEQLIARGAAPSVRDRAWYFLAKVRWQRGLAAPALEALQHIEHPLPGQLEEDRKLLQANVLMATGDNAGAAALLAPLATAKGAPLYARYNLGVAQVRAGDTTRGSKTLDDIGRMGMPNEEQRALRDKANVALGFAALRDGQPQQARAFLERVRLNGLESNQALLGFGWAADALKNPKLALVPWVELAGRDPTDAAVLEAQLAVPYAYAELGASGQALDRYTVAIANFEHENANLDATIGAIRQGKLLEGLMARNPGEQIGWFQTFKDVPLIPHARHLTPVLASNEFQEGFKNYRDLQFMSRNLAHWQDELGVFGDMLATRRQGFSERLPAVTSKAGAVDLDALQRRSDANAAALHDAQAAQDGAAFADAKERELRARLDRAQAALDRLGADADPSVVDARERLRRVKGALAWQLAHEYPAREAGARAQQAETESNLAEARAHGTALAHAQADEPARFEAFARRIAELDTRLNALVPRIASLAQAQAQALDDLAIASLSGQKERLAGYTAQARIAVAQLYDRATEGDGDGGSTQEGGHAAKP